MAFTDVEMSILAQLAYKDIPNNQSLSKVLSDNKSFLKDSLGSDFNDHIDGLISKVKDQDYKIVATENKAASGLAAYAFKTPDNEVVVAARGTEFKHLNDVATDAGLALSLETQQHRDMEDFVRKLESYGYDGYYFTGHSLGGNIATHGAVCISDPNLVKGVNAYNAPGFNAAYWINNEWKLSQINNIKNFKNETDGVSSILKTPGETIMVDSKGGWFRGIFDGHSINDYSINPDGTFDKNKTGLKSVETIWGNVLGGAGQIIGAGIGFGQLIGTTIWGGSNIYVTRDFSDDSKQKMLNLVREVENEKLCDFTDWVGDRWYDFQDWIGTLDIKRYINNANSYHKKVIDKNNATAKKIEEIFTNVRNLDANYATKFDNVSGTMDSLKRFVMEMTQIMTPGSGSFDNHTISGSLGTIADELSKATIQQIKDLLMTNDGGAPVFNEELLLDYIKKNPSQMTFEERQAVLDVIAEMQDTIAFYETGWTLGDQNLGAYFWNKAQWVSETNEFSSFSAVSAHYNNLYVNLLDAIMEQGEDSNTFAAALLKIGSGESFLNILGVEQSEEVSKLFGSSSIGAYLAQWKTEHTEHYFAKLELSEKSTLQSGFKFKNLNDAIEDKLKDSDNFIEEKDTFYLDSEGNEISKKDAPTFYKKQATILEAKQSASASVSIYDGKFDVGENGEIGVTVGNAEAHAGVSAGFYVIGADGEKKFSPGVNAEIGASVTGLEVEWEQQWLGDENLGLNSDAKVTVGKAEAKADIGAQVFGEDGKLDVQLGASAKAEAIAAEAEGKIGVNVLGGEVGVKGSVNFGVGAHADVGYRDGVFKFDIGVSVGVGASVGAEIDVGGMVDTVCDAASSAWDTVSDGWNNFWSKW